MDKLRSHVEGLISSGQVDKNSSSWRTDLPQFPEMEFDAKQNWFWDLVTSEGNITIEFMPELAPNHVANFAYLTELGFFDGLSFHRVISDFMAQGGCPLGSGTGGPGYKFDGECVATAKHDRPGVLSMANTGQPCSDGSQFFLTFTATPWLDMKHTVFGAVTDGLDVVKTLESFGSGDGSTSKPLSIKTAKIRLE